MMKTKLDRCSIDFAAACEMLALKVMEFINSRGDLCRPFSFVLSFQNLELLFHILLHFHQATVKTGRLITDN